MAIRRFFQTNLKKYERISDKLETCRVDRDAMAMMLAELKHGKQGQIWGLEVELSLVMTCLFRCYPNYEVLTHEFGGLSLLTINQCATFHILSHASTAP